MGCACMRAGLHLIKHCAWRTLERGGQFVLLGSAPDPKIQVNLQYGSPLNGMFSSADNHAEMVLTSIADPHENFRYFLGSGTPQIPASGSCLHFVLAVLKIMVHVQAQFNALAASLGGENAHFAFSYDESLSHLIYAACDIIAVPSMFEPCGLTQVPFLTSACQFDRCSISGARFSRPGITCIYFQGTGDGARSLCMSIRKGIIVLLRVYLTIQWLIGNAAD